MRQNLTFIRMTLAIAAVSFTAGCSHLAYQGSKETYSDPKKTGLEYQEVSFASRDGVALSGWFFPARDPENPKVGAAPKGTVIQFHGNAQNMTAHCYSLAWVTLAGYNFFTFDYRGYGKSAGDPNQEGVNLDALAAIEYVQKNVPKPAGAKTDMILYGQSLGGAVLARALSDVADRSRLRAVVLDSTFHSYQSAARDVLSRSFVTYLFQPLAYVLMSDRYSPEESIAKIAPIPLLVIHGDRDETIPFKFGQKVYSLATEPKYFWHIPGGRHIDSMFRDKGKYREPLVQFMDSGVTQSMGEAPKASPSSD